MDAQIAVLAVAEKGSLEAAGKYLGIGKSAVRKRVRSVDSVLGTPVFRSAGKGMVPTDAGNIYLPVTRESVRQASLGVDRVRAFVRVQTNDLRIGSTAQSDFSGTYTSAVRLVAVADRPCLSDQGMLEDLPVLVHVVSQRARVLRLCRTDSPLAISVAAVLPSCYSE